MKFWLSVLFVTLLLFAVFWIFALATGVLEQILGVVVFGAIVAGAIAFWLRRSRSEDERDSDKKDGRHLDRSAQHELKQMEQRLKSERKKAS